MTAFGVDWAGKYVRGHVKRGENMRCRGCRAGGSRLNPINPLRTRFGDSYLNLECFVPTYGSAVLKGLMVVWCQVKACQGKVAGFEGGESAVS